MVAVARVDGNRDDVARVNHAKGEFDKAASFAPAIAETHAPGGAGVW